MVVSSPELPTKGVDDMARLLITVEGDQSDLDFLKDRMVGSVEEVADEYEQNCDGPVVIGYEWSDA